MAKTPCEYEGNISTSRLALGSFATTTANRYEYKTSFTITKNSFVLVKAYYSATAPEGIAISTSSTGMGDSVARNEVNNSYGSSVVSLLAYLPAGTYYVYTVYAQATTGTNKNTLMVDEIKMPV